MNNPNLDEYRVGPLLYTVVHSEEAIFQFDFRKFFPQVGFQIDATNSIQSNEGFFK